MRRPRPELRKEGAGRGEKIITPPMPHIFAKYHNSVTGHGKPVIYPKIVRQLDLEGELTAVIGRRAYYVDEREKQPSPRAVDPRLAADLWTASLTAVGLPPE